MNLFAKLQLTVSQVLSMHVPPERKKILMELIDYVQHCVENKKPVNLNFICTHNSRRSQLSQVWAQTASYYFGLKVQCFSGGVEITAFNKNAVAALKRAGFRITKKNGANPIYFVFYSNDAEHISTFSKMYDDAINPMSEFAAIMTCSHADENCPYIPGASRRIPITYEDPKAFDGTPQELIKYDERSSQIASEMFYVFSQIKLM